MATKKTVELQKKLDVATAKVTELEGRVGRRDATIAELQARVGRRDATIAQLQKNNNGNAVAQLADEKARVGRRDATITQLKAQLAQFQGQGDAKYQLDVTKADLQRQKENAIKFQSRAEALMDVTTTFANALRR